jgi:hypothetical protein
MALPPLDFQPPTRYRPIMPLFTRENAREMAARGNKARWTRPPIPETDPEPVAMPNPVADPFIARRLMRVRAQLDLIDAAIQQEASKGKPDGQRLDRLAAASFKLNDQEFALAGRPKPGQRRPGPDRKQGPWVEIAAQPLQVAPPASAPAPAAAPPCGPDTTTDCGLPPGCELGTPQERK